jgi:hypothetical protein
MVQPHLKSSKEIKELSVSQRKRYARKIGGEGVFHLFEALTMKDKDHFEFLHYRHLSKQPRWVKRRVSTNQGTDRKRKHGANRDAVEDYLKHTPYLTYSHVRENDLIPEMSAASFRDCIVKPLSDKLGLIKTPHKIGREVLYCSPDFDPFTLPEVRPKAFDLIKHPKQAALYLAARSPIRYTQHCDFVEFGKHMRLNPDLFPIKYSNDFMQRFSNRFFAIIFADVLEFSSDADSVPISHVAMFQKPERLDEIRKDAMEAWKNGY